MKKLVTTCEIGIFYQNVIYSFKLTAVTELTSGT